MLTIIEDEIVPGFSNATETSPHRYLRWIAVGVLHYGHRLGLRKLLKGNSGDFLTSLIPFHHSPIAKVDSVVRVKSPRHKNVISFRSTQFSCPHK